MTVVDITTDIMSKHLSPVGTLPSTDSVAVVSIPLLLLRKSQMAIRQKLSLYLFLCLSLVMALAALTRVSGYRLSGVFDLTWQIFWQWTEACVASIMGSVVVFRTLFTHSGSRASEKKERSRFYSVRKYVSRKMKGIVSAKWEELDHDDMPQIPPSAMLGLQKFIWTDQLSRSRMTVRESPLSGRVDEMRISISARENFIFMDEEAALSSKSFGDERSELKALYNSSTTTVTSYQ